MGDDTELERFRSANDNTCRHGEADAETWRRVDQAALRLARIIGRRVAREDFAAQIAANQALTPPCEE